MWWILLVLLFVALLGTGIWCLITYFDQSETVYLIFGILAIVLSLLSIVGAIYLHRQDKKSKNIDEEIQVDFSRLSRLSRESRTFKVLMVCPGDDDKTMLDNVRKVLPDIENIENIENVDLTLLTSVQYSKFTLELIKTMANDMNVYTVSQDWLKHLESNKEDYNLIYFFDCKQTILKQNIQALSNLLSPETLVSFLGHLPPTILQFFKPVDTTIADVKVFVTKNKRNTRSIRSKSYKSRDSYSDIPLYATIDAEQKIPLRRGPECNTQELVVDKNQKVINLFPGEGVMLLKNNIPSTDSKCPNELFARIQTRKNITGYVQSKNVR